MPTNPDHEQAAGNGRSFRLLLDYFRRMRDATPKPVSHPDHAIGESARAQLHRLRQAAVLLPVSRHQPGRESQLVLTVRSANLKRHAGQISLPGGAREEHDRDEEATALRESHEEIGLDPERVEVVGRLGELALPSGYRVTPVVGIIDGETRFNPHSGEVADVFLTPLELVLDTAAYIQSSVTIDGKRRRILELHYEDYRIWGATAAILYHLAREVSGCESAATRR